ncbi:unnamed protein product [Peniophora sp. CBMAI 1063]|nr:unnamed protein product [Peniophora sp. CBMAI 1063]
MLEVALSRHVLVADAKSASVPSLREELAGTRSGDLEMHGVRRAKRETLILTPPRFREEEAQQLAIHRHSSGVVRILNLDVEPNCGPGLARSRRSGLLGALSVITSTEENCAYQKGDLKKPANRYMWKTEEGWNYLAPGFSRQD